MKTPHELAEERMELSEQYSAYSGELAKLIRSEAEFYVAQRPNFKSDTAVQRVFDTTHEGIQMATVKLKLKALEKQMSAIKTMLETLTEEARGMY
jgi:hypothetical protein